MTAVLKTDNLYKDFSGLQVLCGVTMEVAKGERHAVIGPNGSGKTTLFNVITGRYRATAGRVSLFDKDTTHWPPHRIARLGCARSFQINSLFPKMTVYENVRTAVVSRLNRRRNFVRLLAADKVVARESDRIVDLVSLKDVRDVCACELSYGKQRHLELALTIALKPTLIMLDEPMAGLTIEETRSTIQLIRELTEGKTLVLIEHDMDVVFGIADRITVLSRGLVIATGSPAEIREHEEVKRVYLGRK
jgi:branched-chain amino acid transport system ATP-binding protein